MNCSSNFITIYSLEMVPNLRQNRLSESITLCSAVQERKKYEKEQKEAQYFLSDVSKRGKNF